LSCSRVFIALLFAFCAIKINAQSSDTLIIDSTNVKSLTTESKWKAKWNMQPHSPLKATVFSAVIPGAGQLYNKKWWKTIIVYGGIGTCVYFIRDNDKNYLTYRRAYIAAIDGDPNTIPQIEGNASFYNDVQEQYRRWRDISWMALAGVYILQIIDANVDGHLFYYDISPDIHLSIHPSIIPTARGNAGIGLLLNF
jgi:hypothetical protein